MPATPARSASCCHTPRSPGAGGYPLSVAASWRVAFDQLAAADPVALELLTLIAWLAPEPVPVPVPVLDSHPGVLPPTLAEIATDELALPKRVVTLRRHGVAHVDATGFHLHRVPGALLRAWT